MSWPAPDQDSLYFDQVLQQTRDAMRHLRTAKHLIGQIEGTGEAADGLIQVTTDAGGALRRIDLNPRVLRLAPAVIGREVTKAIQAAQDDSARRAKEIVDGVAPYVGALPEPLDETFVQHRVEAAMRDMHSGGL
ncbi:YbaB/EbfC family nucleoid-associated protein [Nonomuraea insulae]|uniref:YbaB/EbfC family nucleoid-associated protein n=1 Tax=Nonomuraea insulae TaxID=1616787 RepID=A0ABW1CAU9_9ACTN